MTHDWKLLNEYDVKRSRVQKYRCSRCLIKSITLTKNKPDTGVFKYPLEWTEQKQKLQKIRKDLCLTDEDVQASLDVMEIIK